jgi:hypothetical protein
MGHSQSQASGAQAESQDSGCTACPCISARFRELVQLTHGQKEQVLSEATLTACFTTPFDSVLATRIAAFAVKVSTCAPSISLQAYARVVSQAASFGILLIARLASILREPSQCVAVALNAGCTPEAVYGTYFDMFSSDGLAMSTAGSASPLTKQ